VLLTGWMAAVCRTGHLHRLPRFDEPALGPFVRCVIGWRLFPDHANYAARSRWPGARPENDPRPAGLPRDLPDCHNRRRLALTTLADAGVRRPLLARGRNPESVANAPGDRAAHLAIAANADRPLGADVAAAPRHDHAGRPIAHSTDYVRGRRTSVGTRRCGKHNAVDYGHGQLAGLAHAGIARIGGGLRLPLLEEQPGPARPADCARRQCTGVGAENRRPDSGPTGMVDQFRRSWTK